MKNSNTKPNWFKRHKVWTGIFIVVGFIIIVGAFGGDEKDKDKSKPISTAKPATSTAKAAPVLAKIGEPANDGKFQFVVNSMKCGETSIGGQYVNKAAQGQFCRLNVSVKNIGDKPQSLSSSDQYLLNAQGQKYGADSTATLYAKSDTAISWYDDVNPGNTVTGDILFDVPKDQTPTTAELHDSAFSGGVKVNLQ